MKLTIENVSAGSATVWTSQINREDLMKLANPIHQGGFLNIVMISSPFFDAKNKTLQFNLDSMTILNLGESSDTLFIDSLDREPKRKPIRKKITVREKIAGDDRFINDLDRLPNSIKKLGEGLLAEIRKRSPGKLIFHPKSGKYVESPDNFWVIRIQPRAQSLRIVIYGRPGEHSHYKNIELKKDMSRYSSFVIDNQRQLADAVKVIMDAKHLKGV